MVDFAAALKGGHGRVEYVFHICGMPWAAATSKDLITYLNGAGIAKKRTMFGSQTYDGGTEYFADDIDLYDILEMPGSQTVTSDDAMSQLSGGTWTAKIADRMSATRAWPHNERTIWGLEGLNSVANPRIDVSIKNARLSEPFRKTDTTITFKDDAGGLLGTACAAASAASPVILWIGGECMAATGGTTSGTDGTATVEVARRGLFNTQKQYHGINNISNGTTSQRVCDAPLGGITNRPCVLWAVLLDEDGTYVSGPVMLRHGKVSGDVSFDGAYWSVGCLPWQAWLDTDMNVQKVNAKLAKYVLSAYDETVVAEFCDTDADKYFFMGMHSPHVIFQEWDEITGESDVMWAWLCNGNAAVKYDTIEDLEAALCDAMTTESAASGNSWTYYPSAIGPITDDCTGDNMYRLAGDLSIILQWGDFSERNNATEWPTTCDWIEEYFTGFYHPITARYKKFIVKNIRANMLHDWGLKHLWNYNFIGPNYDDTMWAYYDAISITKITGKERTRQKPDYIMQWGWNIDTTYPASEWPFCKLFPIPYAPIDGTPTPAIWIDTDYDIQSATDGSIVQIGSDDTDFMLHHTAAGTMTLGTPYSRFSSAGVGAGGATTNYIIAGEDEGYTTPEGYAAIRAVQISDVDPGPYKFTPGMYLFTYPTAHDYWPITQSMDCEADTLSEMLVAILGHSSTVVIAEEIQADHVPWYDTIDWAQLESLITDSLPFETTYAFRYYGTVNLWDIINQELKFCGLTPTWEWNSTDGRYNMRFKLVNSINATMAKLGGRTITESNIETGTKVTAEHAYNWQINSIDFSANYNARSEEYEYHYRVLDNSGYAPTGGKVNTLKIEPKITQIPGLSDNEEIQVRLITYLSQYLENTMDPRPSASLTTTVENFVQIGVGTELQLTTTDIHNPFTGEIGVTTWPCAVAEQTIDPGRNIAKYKVSMAARNTYGWAPSLAIKTSTYAGTTVTVTDLDDSGQMFSGSLSTDGWFDHWFFADCYYNSTMSVPIANGAYTTHVTLIERGSKSPTIITGGTIDDVDLRDYTTITGAAGTFFTIDGVAGYDAAKTWWLVFDKFTETLSDYQRYYIYLADSDSILEDDSAVEIPGREWE